MQKRSKDKRDITKFLPPTPQEKKKKKAKHWISHLPLPLGKLMKKDQKREMKKKKNDIFL